MVVTLLEELDANEWIESLPFDDAIPISIYCGSL